MAAAGASRSAEEDKSDPSRPLALPSPTVYPAPSAHDTETADAARWRSTQYLRKRRCALCCGGCCVSAIVVVGVIILVLALTVFRVKQPRLAVHNVWLTAISAGAGAGPGTGAAAPVAANATLTADVSVKNPNAAAFRFSRTETDVYYEGQTVSVAYAPAGRVGARGTVRMNVTVDLLADRLARVMNGTGLVFGQEYELDTYTAINGTVNVLGIVKKHIEIRLNCSTVIQVGGAAAALEYGAASTVQSKGVDCLADVTL